MNKSTSSATILVADDDEDIRLALELLLTTNGYKVIEASSAKEAVILTLRHCPDLVLLDMNFSRDTTSGQEGLAILEQLNQNQSPVMLMTAWASIDLAVTGLQQGACDFIEKPWHNEKLLNRIAQQLSFAKIKKEHAGYQTLLSESDHNNDWIVASNVMHDIEQTVKQIAPTAANVLILGENGTGKSLLAKRIHQLSTRSQKPFISVNMAAIPENLFESELFGHQKGAFTDAKQHRVGRFQLADQGTLFLDEIGSLPMMLQPKLLRVLETGEYEVLGASQTSLADVRVISATNANLASMVQDNSFRQDLLYRLNTLVITMPALRERIADIIPLATHFIEKHCHKYRKPVKQLTNSAISTLTAHHWPGNIRELSHVIERAVLMTPSDVIEQSHLLIDKSEQVTQEISLQPLEQAERQLIEKALQQTHGSVAQAADILAISRNALYRRLDKFNIQYES